MQKFDAREAMRITVSAGAEHGNRLSATVCRMADPGNQSGMTDTEESTLTWTQRGFLAALGVPALGMALAVTVISTYLPVLVEQISGPVVVGVLIGGEGFFGMFMPALVGGFSDRVSHTVRDRIPLLIGFGALVVLSLTAVAVIAGAGWQTLTGYAVALVFLYAGYYAFLAPYWSLYPDLVPDEQSGRSRSVESVWRVIGVGLALVGGGLLLDVWDGLPFLVAAVLVGVTVTAMVIGTRHRFSTELGDIETGGRFAASRELLRDPRIRVFCVATALWNFALAALRAFVVLFFTIGLDRSNSFVSTVIFPLVAVGIAIAAPLSGWAADRWGHVPLLTVALVVYGLGMSLPGFFQSSWVIAVIPVVAAGAATVMTLPESILMRLVPDGHSHGTASGLYGFSRGLGATLGPVLTGVAIMLLAPVFDSTEGYAAMWLVCSAALLASIPVLWALRGDDRL